MPPSHPVYGPHLEDYVRFYTVEVCRREVRRDPSRILSSFWDVINCGLNLPEDIIENSISLDLLKSLLGYTLCSDSIISLASPILARMCIMLMEKMYSQEQSGFRYEYGFLCFRVFVISHALCFLKQHGRLAEFMQAMDRAPHQEFNELLAQTFCRFIVDDFEKYGGKVYYGWVHQSNGPLELVNYRQIYALTRILYHDRKFFFASLMKTHGPGLSWLFFTLLQYMKYEVPEPRPDPTEFSHPVYDLLFRYLIVLPWDERPAIHFLRDRLLWEHPFPQFVCVDIEDSRNVLSAFGQCFGGSHAHYSLTLDGLASVLHVAVKIAVPGCEDLLPAFFEAIVNQMWDAAINDSLTQRGTLKDCVWQILLMMSTELASLKDQLIAQAVVLKIVGVLARNDFVDLLVRIAFTLNPQVTKTSYEDWTKGGENHKFRLCAINVCQKLGDHVSRDVLKKTLSPLLDWHKYGNYVIWSMAQHDPSSQEYIHYSIFLGFLHDLREAGFVDIRGVLYSWVCGIVAPLVISCIAVSGAKQLIGSLGYIKTHVLWESQVKAVGHT